MEIGRFSQLCEGRLPGNAGDGVPIVMTVNSRSTIYLHICVYICVQAQYTEDTGQYRANLRASSSDVDNLSLVLR